jgi:hypothetical protein
MDLLERCIASIDYPIENLVIVFNNPDEYPKFDRVMTKTVLDVLTQYVQKFHTIVHPNAGVAGSWNEIITLFPAPYWMLVNDDIQFTPGDLAKMAEFLMGNANGIGEVNRIGCCYGNHGASWWSVTRLGVNKVGLFDENFFPAYLEDCDWSRRADLAGVARVDVPDVHSVHGEPNQRGSCTVNVNAKLAHANSRTHHENHGLYRYKHGGPNGYETYKTVYNIPGMPVSYWRFIPEYRAQQVAIWRDV